MQPAQTPPDGPVPQPFEQSFNRATELLTAGRVDEAAAEFERAIALNPRFSWSHHGLGDALFRREEWERAATAYERAAHLRADVSWTHHHLGNCLSKLHRWRDAVVAYRRAIEIEPDVASASFNLGSALSFAQVLPPGVYIAMNGQHFTWNNVRKNHHTGVFERRVPEPTRALDL